MAKQYAREYEEHSSYGSAVRLVARAGLTPGVILDLGCGRSPVAAHLTEMGFTYVGSDVDVLALEDLRGRGFEAHELDLSGPPAEIRERLDGLLTGRPLAAVLALDVIEHLVDPIGLLDALHQLVAAHEQAELVVSIPNVTHVDLGTKLLSGRWDMTDTGLLDDTHLQFFSPARLDGMLAGTGWHQVDADDVDLPISDQCFPVDLPGLRRGAPLHDVLAWMRASAGPAGETYQFVRRLRPVEPVAVTVPRAGDIARVVDEDRRLASVIVTVADAAEADGLAPLLGDLAAQTESFDVVVVGPAGALDPAGIGADATWVEAVPGLDALTAVLQGAQGRYACVLGARCRVSPDWLAGIAEAADLLPAALIHLPLHHAPAADLGFWGAKPFVEAAAAATEAAPANWDLFHDAPFGSSALAGLAVPIESVQAAGLAPEPDDGDLAWVAFALRVALMAGSLPCPRGAVLVPDDDLVDVDARWDQLQAALAGVPLVGRSGSIGRFGVIRARLDHHRRVETELRGAIDDKDRELSALIFHTAELGRQIDGLEAQVHRFEQRPWNLLKRALRKVAGG